MKKHLLLLALFGIIISASAQTSKRCGLSAGIQGNQYGIAVPIRLTETFALIPAVDFAYVEKNSSDLAAGLAARFYKSNTRLSPFVALRAGLGLNMPNKENTIPAVDKSNKLDLLGGIGFGAEYFFDEHFSISIEAQGNVTKSDVNSFRFGNPDGINFNTATMVSATIYF